MSVMIRGIDAVRDELEVAKIDPLIGNVRVSMTQEDIQELEEANMSDDSFLLVDQATDVYSPSGLRGLFDLYDLPKRVTKTSFRALKAERVRQLAKEIKAIYPEFESEHLKVTHSKSSVHTKDDLIDAILGMAKKSN